MLTLEDLKKQTPDGSEEIKQNFRTLLEKLQKIEDAYGKKLNFTSVFRSMKDHLRIYAEKNAALKKAGKSEIKVPMASKHLFGQAADIADADGAFWKWAMINANILKDLGIHLEDRGSTPTWTHVQIVPPASGKFIFIP
jgi:uncharacterized protein YcbK (DUF882 family)